MDASADRTTYLVEHYWPDVTRADFAAASERVCAAADELEHEGRHFRCLHSTRVPEDESAFCLFEAESAAVIEEAYAPAGVPDERLLGAVEIESQKRRVGSG